MAELKTKPGTGSVEDFLASIPDQEKQADSRRLIELMSRLTGDLPVLWGPAIVGFGNEHLRYASGRELDWFKVGFSPRKQAITLYTLPGAGASPDLLARLGRFTTGKGCLYIKRLNDVDMQVLEELVRRSLHPAQT